MSAPCKTRLVFGKEQPLGVRAHAAESNATPVDFAAHYGFPDAGPIATWVAVPELGGGYSPADIKLCCDEIGVTAPPIVDMGVGGVTNSYTGNPNSADGEVGLDMQTIIRMTKGKVGLIMGWSPNTDSGFPAIINLLAADGRASALSNSWGQNEKGWTASAMQAMVQAGLNCAAKGISPFAASGDDGSSDGSPGNNVDVPASLVSWIGCGGTSLASGAETAWSFGGGGLSREFKKPTWQLIGGNMRGVPDLSANADPNSGYPVYIAGKRYLFGGTSAVAPLWAAAVALIVSHTGKKLGFFLPDLYTHADLTDITTGSNGAYKAGVGYDFCAGLGVPNAAFFARMLSAAPPVPPTPPDPGQPPLPPVAQAHTIQFDGPYTLDGVAHN